MSESLNVFVLALLNVLPVLAVLLGFVVQAEASRKQRRYEAFSEALRAVEDYLEAVYLIRRRDGRAETKQRLVWHLADVQSRIAYYSNLLRVSESISLNEKYDAYVCAARGDAGPQMAKAWKARAKRKRDVSIGARFDRSASDQALNRLLREMKLARKPFMGERSR